MWPKLSRSFVSLVLFFAAAKALPQCDYQLQYSGQYRASILDLSIDNNDLWAASGYGVQLYDRSVDPPRLVASVGLPGITSIVRASNGVAYAGGTSRITVVSRGGGRTLQIAPIPFEGVNDLAVQGTTLYAASSSGITAFDARSLSRLPATFPTSSPAVSSLALSGSMLYAADGDNTLEVFSGIQKLGTVATAVRATSVEALGSRLFVSDGIRTEVLTGSGTTFSSLGTFPYPTRSLTDLGSNVVMIAGSDRQLRAIDVTLPQNFVELFDGELAPSGGTINRVTALQVAGGRLYAAGGDIGLTTYDISRFKPPFPLRAYAIGSTTSIVTLPGAFYASLPDGGIQELNHQTSGGLVTARLWDTAEVSTVQDASDPFLLASSGNKLTLWFLSSTIPTSPFPTVAFTGSVRRAFLSGTGKAIALLADGTIWTVDFTQTPPTPLRVATDIGPVLQLAHSDAGIAATNLSADGTSTTVRFWSGSDFTSAPINVSVPGVATALALSGSTGAIFTFRGATVIDFATSTQRLLAGSNDTITTALDLSGGTAIGLTQAGTIRVWDVASGRLEKEFVVPGGAIAIDALQGSSAVGVATTTGVATLEYGTPTSQPAVIARSGGNTYYKKAVAGGRHLYLFDGRVIDIYDVKSANAPSWSGSVFAPGTLDIAASDTALFTLSNSEVVTEYSAEGVLLRSKALDEGSNVTPLAIGTAAGAPWISFSRGCTTGGCEKHTDVLDPLSLVRTAQLAGGTVDVTTTGSRAYAIFDLPAEIRVYDVSDPLHPSPLATRLNDPGAVAVAFSRDTVYALADKIFAYSDRTLTATGVQLSSQKPASSADLLIDSGCATVAGRSASAEVYGLPAWTASSTMPVPGNIRSMLFASGRLIILTDYSIEIWSRTAAPVPVRRRAAKD